MKDLTPAAALRAARKLLGESADVCYILPGDSDRLHSGYDIWADRTCYGYGRTRRAALARAREAVAKMRQMKAVVKEMRKAARKEGK